MKDDKKSIIKEALTDYQEIMEAADANAKKKLAEEFPDKFNNLLKEEINKNKKSVKESYKKLDDNEESEESDEAELNNESVMKNQVKETPKVVKETAGSSKPFGEKPKGVAKVEEDVKITDTVGSGDPFKEKAKGAKKIDEEREKDFMGDVEGQTPNVGKGELEKGVAFKDKIKGPSSGKPMSNLTEEFDITELDMNGVDSTISGAADDDEVLTMEQIEEEIASMQGLGEELGGMSGMPRPELKKQGSPANQGGDAYSQLVQMRKQLDEMIGSLGGVNEMGQGGASQEGEFDSRMVQEEEISDDEINAVLGSPEGMGVEQPVDEAMGISYSAGTITPGKLGDHEGTHGRFRQDESKKKINGLINENKSLTKKINEVKAYKKSVGTLLEQYKTALDKYRNQLKEMAVFNTNLAHVNNLLINESLALTQDDKIKIINEFKKVDTIAESQKRYKNFLTEMKGSKKTLTESIEEKVTTSIQPSSKQKLDEVTAYKDDKHIQKMRNLIEYVEKRGKRIIT
jgi:hypothetical protein